MKSELETAIAAICKKVFGADASIELTRPDEQFGDYATNVALQLAKSLGKKPRDIAEELAERLRTDFAETVTSVAVAGPGFINLTLSDGALYEAASGEPAQPLAGKTIVAEYSDPNPFKVVHAGHLYTSAVGFAISNLLAAAGGQVHRVNYGGDVGLHVGKTMWAILRELGGEYPERLHDVPENGRSEWMAKCYVAGTAAYEDDETAKDDIIALNKRVYQLFATDDHDSPFAQIYWTCRQWSYDYFDTFYARIGTPFEKYYPESEVADLGLATVREQLQKGVYKESDGAVVFEGEPYGLHTRVFINSHGLPTYEAKEVGLIQRKWQDYHYDLSVYITGNEQEQYLAVVMKSIEQFAPELTAGVKHLTHGLVKLQGGVKMSSRKGNILRATDVIDAANDANRQANGREDEATVLGAIKYAFLKNRIGGDIVYDPQESVSLEGNSGPYLQYAHARARSILRKISAADEHKNDAPDDAATSDKKVALESGERSLLRKISEYPEIVDQAVASLMPHYICTYLYELAQTFNRFYEHNRVAGDPRETVRRELVERYTANLKHGLTLLGIAAPEQL